MLCPRAHAQSMAWTERISRCQGEYNAREAPAASPISSCRSTAANRQDHWRRETSSAATYLLHGDGVVPAKDWIYRFRSHLHAKHKQHKPISDVCTRVHTSAESNCAGRCTGMGAGARRGRVQMGTTARGAWGRPAHRHLKVQPPLLLNAPQRRPARIPQAEHVSAASARDHEVDMLGAHSARSVTISGIPLAAGSGAPSRLERR